jgi:hypothetical protein
VAGVLLAHNVNFTTEDDEHPIALIALHEEGVIRTEVLVTQHAAQVGTHVEGQLPEEVDRCKAIRKS